MAVNELGVMCNPSAEEARTSKTAIEELATISGLPIMKVTKELKGLVWRPRRSGEAGKKESRTGCNEKAAAIEMSGTRAVAIPRERINGIGTKIRVERAMATVRPEIATVRPALAIVRTIDSLISLDWSADSFLNRKSMSNE